MTDPKTISLLDLRPRLSDIIRDVEAGGSYVVTRYGEPVAVLSPTSVVTVTGKITESHMDGDVRVVDKVELDKATVSADDLSRKRDSFEQAGDNRVGIDVTELANTPKASRQAQVDAILGKVNRKAKEKR